MCISAINETTPFSISMGNSSALMDACISIDIKKLKRKIPKMYFTEKIINLMINKIVMCNISVEFSVVTNTYLVKYSFYSILICLIIII